MLAPGSYGDVSVKSRATLRLSPGTFFVNSFSIEPQATVVTDGGPVFLYIATSMNFKGAISAGVFDRNFLVGVVGSGTVFLETPFTGTIVAPNATIRFAPLNPGVYDGFLLRARDRPPAGQRHQFEDVAGVGNAVSAARPTARRPPRNGYLCLAAGRRVARRLRLRQ